MSKHVYKKYFILWLLSFSSLAVFAQDSIPQKLKLLFVGDIMGHKPQIKSAEITPNKMYDYLPCFQYVRPIIEQADFAIGNLEVTLPGKAPYQGYPRFRSPDDLAVALRNSGFDMMVTANNHSNDSGKKGVIHTLDVLQENGFYHTGTFKNQSDRDLYYPLIVYRNGFKLAFLNYTYDTNGLKTKPPTVVNLIEPTQIQKDIQAAQKMKPDAIIVLMHWGLEYRLKESPVQKKLAEQIFAWGADLVIGSHPHVVEPIRTMQVPQKDGSIKEVLVTYSLGNFISNQNKPNTDGGLVFEISLEKDPVSKKVKLGEHHFIPVWRYIHKDKLGKRTYHALPIAAFEQGDYDLGMTEKDKKAMKKYAQHVRKLLAKSDSTERKITLSELNLTTSTPVQKAGSN
ncbi:MAG: CapA family protein [Saprospiraceae bacterium]